MARKPDINNFDRDGNAPLHNAVMLENTVEVDRLLAEGANINIRDQKLKMTPLHYAALSDNEVIIDKLLSAGADQTITDKFKSTAEEGANAKGKQVFAAFRARQEAIQLDAMTIQAGAWSPSQADAVALSPSATHEHPQCQQEVRARRL